jgi:hypothetical protein
MKTRFIVLLAKGPSWDAATLRRSQARWDEHAAFVDKLTADGFVVLGGPLGEDDGEDAVGSRCKLRRRDSLALAE